MEQEKAKKIGYHVSNLSRLFRFQEVQVHPDEEPRISFISFKRVHREARGGKNVRIPRILGPQLISLLQHSATVLRELNKSYQESAIHGKIALKI